MIVISIEHISKYYRLGSIGNRTLYEDLNRWWAKVRGKPDPTLRVDQLPPPKEQQGTTNEEPRTNNQEPRTTNEERRTKNEERRTKNEGYIWALRDVSLEVRQGEVLGIIGRNGAGKSTLLKILSQVTAPTAGQVKVRGRIASLPEVGTGFHPDLTGRENTFLNGAILGMTRQEIKRKFDEIVACAEVFHASPFTNKGCHPCKNTLS